MAKIHFFGFKDRTRDKMYEVVAWLRNNLATTTSTKDLAARILCEVEFVGHPTSLVVNAQLEDRPYILVQSSNVLWSQELVTSLAHMPNQVKIVEGATLRRFVAAKRLTGTTHYGGHAGECEGNAWRRVLGGDW